MRLIAKAYRGLAGYGISGNQCVSGIGILFENQEDLIVSPVLEAYPESGIVFGHHGHDIVGRP
jgi:hypothetical protein